MTAAALVALALALSSASASATAAAATATDAALGAARAKYDAVAYDEALAILEDALAHAPPAAERARLLAFEALVKAQMADDAGARRSLADAVAADVCVALPDAPAPPALVDEYARVHAAVLAGRAAGVEAAPTPAPAAASSSSSATVVWASAAVLGAGGALALGGGAVVSALALQTHADAATAEFQSDALARDQSARDQLLVADTLLASGGVLVACALVAAGTAVALE